MKTEKKGLECCGQVEEREKKKCFRHEYPVKLEKRILKVQCVAVLGEANPWEDTAWWKGGMEIGSQCDGKAGGEQGVWGKNW